MYRIKTSATNNWKFQQLQKLIRFDSIVSFIIESIELEKSARNLSFSFVSVCLRIVLLVFPFKSAHWFLLFSPQKEKEKIKNKI